MRPAFSISFLVVVVALGMASALPKPDRRDQVAAGGGGAGGNPNQRFFLPNLIGAAQGAVNGFLNPYGYGGGFGGYPGGFGGGFGGYPGGFGGGFGGYPGGFGGGFGGYPGGFGGYPGYGYGGGFYG
ncbi:keratin-associated protein 19-2-like [Macrobrachium nipponense]|uniref:keratin-associated protein 19-2-like n=1 Tax=Macrobrachium nipponense TaxID=159736 RepID=UPI0030C8CD65